jgi:hypothetical protein
VDRAEPAGSRPGLLPAVQGQLIVQEPSTFLLMKINPVPLSGGERTQMRLRYSFFPAVAVLRIVNRVTSSLIRSLPCAAALLLLAGPPAVAQGRPGGSGVSGVSPALVLAYLDVDKDGSVVLNDFLTRQLPKFTQFDADGDGALSYREFRESLDDGARRNAERSFEAFDKEELRKRLTQREFLGYHAFIFRTFLDRDKDGVLTEMEWNKAMVGGSRR